MRLLSPIGYMLFRSAWRLDERAAAHHAMIMKLFSDYRKLKEFLFSFVTRACMPQGHSMPTHQMVAADPPHILFKFGMLIDLSEI